jgi:hypothetical protein
MSDDNVMYDLPTDFLHEAAEGGDACTAQSVIPVDGGYRCACSCERWETIAPTREEGLRLAREHTDRLSRQPTALVAPPG